MGKDFKNDFTWSITRHNTFQECKRKYYYNYYGFWNGWFKDSGYPTRNLYVLKNLESRFQWKGKLIHNEIAMVLREFVTTKTIPDFKKSLNRVTKTMNQQFKYSQTGNYWNHNGSMKDKTALYEHEYNQPIDNSHWKKIHREVCESIKNFYQSHILREIESLGKDSIITIDDSVKPASFVLNGTTTFANIDLAYKKDGTVNIVDWKTGENLDEDRTHFQLLVYSLFACNSMGLHPDEVKMVMYNLNQDNYTSYDVTDNMLQQAYSVVKDSMDDMKLMLRDKKNNIAEMTDFQRVDNYDFCKYCNFEKICFELD